MKKPEVSDHFRDMLTHLGAYSGVSKEAFKNACEYVAELEEFKAKILKAVNG
jgi:hypothetical protein